MAETENFRRICQKVKKSTGNSHKKDLTVLSALYHQIVRKSNAKDGVWFVKPSQDTNLFESDFLACPGVSRPYEGTNNLYRIDMEMAKEYAGIISSEFPSLGRNNGETSVHGSVKPLKLPKVKPNPYHRPSPHSTTYTPSVNPRQWKEPEKTQWAIDQLRNDTSSPELSKMLANLLEATSKASSVYDEVIKDMFETLEVALGAQKRDLDEVNEILASMQYASSRFNSFDEFFGDRGKVWMIHHSEKIRELESIMASLFARKADAIEKESGTRPIPAFASNVKETAELILSPFSMEETQQFLWDQLQDSIKRGTLPSDFQESITKEIYEEVKVRLSNEIRCFINSSCDKGDLDARDGLWILRLFDTMITMVEAGLDRYQTPKIAAGGFIKGLMHWVVGLFMTFLVFGQIYALLISPVGHNPLEIHIPVASQVYQSSFERMGKYVRANFTTNNDKPLNILALRNQLAAESSSEARRAKDLRAAALREMENALIQLDYVSDTTRLEFLEERTPQLEEANRVLNEKIQDLERLNQQVVEASRRLAPGGPHSRAFEKMMKSSLISRSQEGLSADVYEEVLLKSIEATDGSFVAELCRDSLNQWTLPELRDVAVTNQICDDLTKEINNYKATRESVKKDLYAAIPDPNAFKRELQAYHKFHKLYTADAKSVTHDISQAEKVLSRTEEAIKYARATEEENQDRLAHASALAQLFDPQNVQSVTFTDKTDGMNVTMQGPELIGCRDAAAYMDFKRGSETSIVDTWLGATFDDKGITGRIARSNILANIIRGTEGYAKSILEGWQYARRRDKGQSPWMSDVIGTWISSMLKWCTTLGALSVTLSCSMTVGSSVIASNSLCQRKRMKLENIRNGVCQEFDRLSQIPFVRQALRLWERASGKISWVAGGVYSGANKLRIKRNARDTSKLAYVYALMPVFSLGVMAANYLMAKSISDASSATSNMLNPIYPLPEEAIQAAEGMALLHNLWTLIEPFVPKEVSVHTTLTGMQLALGLMNTLAFRRPRNTPEVNTPPVSEGTVAVLPEKKDIILLKDTGLGTRLGATAHSFLYTVSNLHLFTYKSLMKSLAYFFTPSGGDVSNIDWDELTPEKIAELGLVKHHLVSSSLNIVVLWSLNQLMGQIVLYNTPAHGFEKAASKALQENTPLSEDWIGNRILRPGETSNFELDVAKRQTCERFFDSFLRETAPPGEGYLADLINDPNKVKSFLQLTARFPELQQRASAALKAAGTAIKDSEAAESLVRTLIDHKETIKQFFVTGNLDVKSLSD